MDEVMIKAPFGNAATGANPSDRGKQGTKRSLLTDGAGIPLALIVDGANRHDVRLLSDTLDGLVISRPQPTPEQLQHVYLNAAYILTQSTKNCSHGITSRTSAVAVKRNTRKRSSLGIVRDDGASNATISGSIAPADSWFAREKKSKNYLAFLHLACAQLIFAKLVVFG